MVTGKSWLLLNISYLLSFITLSLRLGVFIHTLNAKVSYRVGGLAHLNKTLHFDRKVLQNRVFEATFVPDGHKTEIWNPYVGDNLLSALSWGVVEGV